MSLKEALTAALLLIVVTALPFPQPPAAGAESTGRLYPETGFTLASEFVNFYDEHGGGPLFGYPVTEAREENGYLAQWTERQRLEWHPEHAGTAFEVQLGLLGTELTYGLDGPRFRSDSTGGSSIGNQASG